jgi:hypothetical protein
MIIALVLLVALGFLVGWIFGRRELVVCVVVSAASVAIVMVAQRNSLLVIASATVGTVIATEAGFFLALVVAAARHAVDKRSRAPAPERRPTKDSSAPPQ